MLRRRVRVSEHYRIPWDVRNLHKRYEFYDQARDFMFYLSWMDLYGASFPSGPENQFWDRFSPVERIEPLYENDFDHNGNNDVAACDAFFNAPGGGGAAGVPLDLINYARNGTLRARMFSVDEIRLGALLGIWSADQGPTIAAPALNRHIQSLQDLDFVCRVVNNQGGGGGRASYATATLPQQWINTNVLYHIIAMLLVKLYGPFNKQTSLSGKQSLSTKFTDALPAVFYFPGPAAYCVWPHPIATASHAAAHRTLVSRHDPTTPDATPLSPDARRDRTNVRLKLRTMPSVLHVSQGSILFPPHYRKPQYRNDITSRLSLSLDIAPFPLSLRL